MVFKYITKQRAREIIMSSYYLELLVSKGDHPVLLLPGAIGSTRTDFEAQLLTMNRDKFTVIAMDPRGYGKSIPPERDWPLEYHSRDADDAITLVKKLGISRISLIGWSDGAVVAMMMAARSPDLIHSIAQWGGNAYVIKEDVIQFDALGLNDINNWSSKMKRPFLELYGETYFMKIWKEWYDAYCAYLTHRNGDMCVGEIANIQCPTLIIHGANDPIVLMEHPEYLHKHIRNSRFVLMPDASHNLHIQFTKEFNELVEDFFIEHSDSSSTNAT